MSDDTWAGESTPFFMSSFVLYSCFSCQCVPSSLQGKKAASLLNSMRNVCTSIPAHLLLYSVKSKSVPPHICLRQIAKQLLLGIFKCLGLKNVFNMICFCWTKGTKEYLCETRLAAAVEPFGTQKSNTVIRPKPPAGAFSLWPTNGGLGQEGANMS